MRAGVVSTSCTLLRNSDWLVKEKNILKYEAGSGDEKSAHKHIKQIAWSVQLPLRPVTKEYAARNGNYIPRATCMQ